MLATILLSVDKGASHGKGIRNLFSPEP